MSDCLVGPHTFFGRFVHAHVNLPQVIFAEESLNGVLDPLIDVGALVASARPEVPIYHSHAALLEMDRQELIYPSDRLHIGS
jgi:hypothetical protein